jgi:hypothetical protein
MPLGCSCQMQDQREDSLSLCRCTLLALKVLGQHPCPNSSINLPYMDGTLAQISRWWVATSLLDSACSSIRPFSTSPPLTFSLSALLTHPSTYINIFTILSPSRTKSEMSMTGVDNVECLGNYIACKYDPNFTISHLQSQSVHSLLEKNYVNFHNKCEPPRSPSNSPLESADGTSVSFLGNNFTPEDTVSTLHTQPSTVTRAQTQRKITDWTVLTPFISNIATNSSPPANISPRVHVSDYLLPYGTPLPEIDGTKTLCICMQNPKFYFKLYDDAVDITNILINLKELQVQMFIPISPNVNWLNHSNWLCTKNLFCLLSSHIHISANSSDMGSNKEYFNKQLVGGTAIITSCIRATQVSSYRGDDNCFGSFSVTILQG